MTSFVKPSFLLLAASWLNLPLAANADPLEDGFRHPPDSARPQTWWHWMNGNITKEGITADLEAMKDIGLGGATIVNVDSGIPPGNVAFMSLQHVVSSELRVTGPTNVSAMLPQPATKLDYYRDIDVLAFPQIDGNFRTIPDFAAKICEDGAREQKEMPSSPDNDSSTQGALQRGDIVNLTAELTPEGKLNWQVPPGEWVIQRFGYTPTSAKNHPVPDARDVALG